MKNSEAKFRLVLASGSPRRRELIGHLGIPFDLIVKPIDEERPAPNPIKYVQELAIEKGRAVAEALISGEKKLSDSSSIPLIISADTTVALGNKIFGKPQDKNHAREILNELAGKTHHVYTGVAIYSPTLGLHSFVDDSKVEFAPISPDIMEIYLETGDSLDKAGAYGIQGAGLLFIKSVSGSYSNVVGLPLEKLVTELRNYLKPFLKQLENPAEDLIFSKSKNLNRGSLVEQIFSFKK